MCSTLSFRMWWESVFLVIFYHENNKGSFIIYSPACNRREIKCKWYFASTQPFHKSKRWLLLQNKSKKSYPGMRCLFLIFSDFGRILIILFHDKHFSSEPFEGTKSLLSILWRSQKKDYPTNFFSAPTRSVKD